ncbi:SoxS protein (plasmid) [Paracoccus sp. TK19116]|uniref:SoxS protein n=1 Tax=Paracoccus albicereus TaxID=2922394 RepID=A0ABT1ML89_9RHOB|nr:SoxS protein [Paracoccus albicereus]MCQ0969060.1 SoxS protein [Paracoccus albicereus]
MRRILVALRLAMMLGIATVGTGQATTPIVSEHEVDWQAAPVRLLMVEQRGCVYCARWDQEIGPGYAASEEGRAAPLLRVDIDGPWPDGLAIGPRPVITPTFILLDHGIEVGRIDGYVGEAYFYPVLRETFSDLDRSRGPGAGTAVID